MLVAVELSEDGRRYAAVNVAALEDAGAFGAAISVSPQQLDAAAKKSRWKALWIPTVDYVGLAAEP